MPASSPSPRPYKRKTASQSEITSSTSMPHNPAMERAVIAGMLVDPFCVAKAIEILGTEKAFFVSSYAHIFRVIFQLYAADKKVAIDLFLVADALRKENHLEEMGGDLFLAELQNSIASTANCESWINIVLENFILRQMIQACTESITLCHTLKDDHDRNIEPAETIDLIESAILKVRKETEHKEIASWENVLRGTFNDINDILANKKQSALSTGFVDIDRKIQGGLKPGEMFVLAARPSIGKTSFALNIIRNVLQHGKTVAFFSLEMTENQIARRLLCNRACVSESAIIPNNQRLNGINQRLTGVMDELLKWKLFVDPTPQLRVMELRAKARRLHRESALDLIVIDYLQLMKASGNSESRQQEVAEISGGIKALAKELNIPIVALAQLSRESEKNDSPNARPKLSHLRESGAIEQDADIVAFLHRNRDAQKKQGSENPEAQLDAECIIEKNRNGETGRVDLWFVPAFTDFRSKPRFSAEDRPSERSSRE